jgi:hypothetical protein
MSSWQYAFLFPSSKEILRPSRALYQFNCNGFEFDRKIRLCVQLDVAGHLLDVGDEINLGDPVVKNLIDYLEKGVPFSIQVTNKHIQISCHFNINCKNPHISFGWSRRLFGMMPIDQQKVFWIALRSFARDCNAAFVFIIDDAPDDFEDRFIEVDNDYFIDMEVNHRYGLGLRQVWIRTSFVQKPPLGPTYNSSDDIGDDFKLYFVKSDR